MTAGDAVRIRTLTGETQVTFAKRIGLHPMSLSRLENGRQSITPTMTILYAQIEGSMR